MLKIAVCIKQIPLIEEANFDAVTKTIKRDGPAVISAYDLRAIALAVELKKIPRRGDDGRHDGAAAGAQCAGRRARDGDGSRGAP